MVLSGKNRGDAPESVSAGFRAQRRAPRTIRTDLARELQLDTDLKAASAFALTRFASPEGREETVLSYNAGSDTLTLDAGDSSFDPKTELETVVVKH